jgi:hypothetical protein
MRWIYFLFLVLTLNLFADARQRLFNLYQQGNYLQACNLGLQGFTYNKNDESYVSLYAFSCLKADIIDRLSAPITTLTQTPEARANASYFAIIVMQKKLLMQAFYDQKPIKNLKFPTSSFLLSKVFDLYVQNPQPSQVIKEYQDLSDNRRTYKLYPTEVNGRKSIAIDEYYDKILTFHHVY